MKSAYFKRLFSILFVIGIVTGLFHLFLLPMSDGVIQTMNKTVGTNKIDVLCVGSSHMYCGINPIQLYEDRGIAAYDIAIGSQAPWQSYYYLREACRTQEPKLIIFDTYMVGMVQDLNHYEDYQTVANLLCFPISWNKLRAIVVSDADNKLDLFLGFPYTHDDMDRYPINETERIERGFDYYMGYQYNDAVYPYYYVENIDCVEKESPIHPKNELYLRLIIEYCINNHIDILLTNAPCPCINIESQEYFNYIKAIANEYKVKFIDGCEEYTDIGIDYLTDSYGDGGHLNYSGVTKYTTYIEKYLDANYDLPDHRGDKEYFMYDMGVNKLKKEIDSNE